MNKRYESAWDALYDDPEEANDLKKRSDYLILIQARLNGMSRNAEDKADLLGIPLEQISDIMKGCIRDFSLNQLIGIARKAGVTSKP